MGGFDILDTALSYLNKGGVVALLIIIVLALWKGWVVRASEYTAVVLENARLVQTNEVLMKTLDNVTQGIAHPVRQTLDAIPTAPSPGSST